MFTRGLCTLFIAYSLIYILRLSVTVTKLITVPFGETNYTSCALYFIYSTSWKKLLRYRFFFITRCQCGNRMKQILSLFSARKHFLRCGGHIHVFILLFLLYGQLFTGVCKSASCTCQGGTCLYCFPQFLISIPASLANKMLTMHQR